MAWFLPVYSRPHLLMKLLEAPGGLPDGLVILIAPDSPSFDKYKRVCTGHGLTLVPVGSGLGDSIRWAFEHFPDEPFYGFFGDDHWPVTPGCWKRLEEAAADLYVSFSAGGTHGPDGCSIIGGTFCVGGELARAMGGVVPPGFIHNFWDNVIETVATDFDLLRPCPEVRIEHRHWINEAAPKDVCYARGEANFAKDKATYKDWLNGNARMKTNERVAAMLGLKVSSVDLKAMQLAICIPTHDFRSDIVFDQSLDLSRILMMQHGLRHTIHRNGGGSHVAKARERLLWDAMKTGCTHIMFADTDMGWEAKLPLHLLAAGHDFTGVVGVKKVEELAVCCNFYDGVQEFHPHTEFLKVPEMGFGFVIFKREVVDRLCAAHPELKYTDDGTATGNVEYALFMDVIDGYRRLSEDLAFCKRWTDLGGEIWIDHQIALIHVGRKEYTGRVADIFQVQAKVAVAEPALLRPQVLRGPAVDRDNALTGHLEAAE